MSAAANLMYNASGGALCHDTTVLSGPAGPGAVWLYQWCTERCGQELPYYPATGARDMFWDQGLDTMSHPLKYS